MEVEARFKSCMSSKLHPSLDMQHASTPRRCLCPLFCHPSFHPIHKRMQGIAADCQHRAPVRVASVSARWLALHTPLLDLFPSLCSCFSRFPRYGATRVHDESAPVLSLCAGVYVSSVYVCV